MSDGSAPDPERVLHCWQDELAHVTDTYGYGSDQWAKHLVRDCGGTCMLEDGHGGPHEFTPDDEIGVRFK